MISLGIRLNLLRALILLFYIQTLLAIDIDGRSPYNGSVKSSALYAAYDGPINQMYKTFAVFLLGSMKNAVILGEEKPAGDYHDFYRRILASRMTWAKHLRYFFMVTGDGESERRVFSRSKSCQNISDHYLVLMAGGRRQIYDCGHGVTVLHLPHCNSHSWGAHGPCCRCQGAMQMYLDMHQAALDSSPREPFPDWLMFSDDDYYVRVTALESFLFHAAISPSDPVAIVTLGGMRTLAHPKRRESTRLGYGGHLYNANCSNPCVHSMPWLSWAGLSVGAVRQLLAGSESNGLVRVCRRWSTTHDVGLGVWAWMHGLTAVGVPEKRGTPLGLVFHKPWQYEGFGWKMDEIFLRVWSLASTSADPDGAFDIEAYWRHEREAGRQLATALKIQHLSASRSTLMFRRAFVRESVLAHFHNNSSPPLPEHQMLRDYSPADCDEDMSLYRAWRRGHPRTPPPEHEALQCRDYALYVAQVPVELDSLGPLPRDDLWTRRR